MLPRPVVALSHICVAQISCGHSHCCAVTDGGDVWAWGSSRTFGHTEQSAYPNVPTMIKAEKTHPCCRTFGFKFVCFCWESWFRRRQGALGLSTMISPSFFILLLVSFAFLWCDCQVLAGKAIVHVACGVTLVPFVYGLSGQFQHIPAETR